MPDPDLRWQPTSGFAPFAQSGRSGRPGHPGVRLVPLERRPLATLVCRSGRERDFAAAVAARFALPVPAAGRAAMGEGGDLVWSAQGQWLAVGGPTQSLADLPSLFAGVAAVTDQTDSRAIVTISGQQSRDMLAKGLAIDLHPAVFAIGAAAVTSLDHVSVQIWQVHDAPVFRLAVPRTYAGSLWSWLTDAAAEFGCDVGEGP